MRNVRGAPWITPWYDGPPIGKDERQARQQEDDVFASALLREACLDLFMRTANRYHISMDDAMACHLGYCARPKEPGLSPAPLKTASAMRMAA